MSKYIDERIDAAFQQTQGNPRQMVQLLLQWAMEDELLEDGFLANFRKPAVTYHVQRFLHQKNKKSTANDGGINPEMLEDIVEQISLNPSPANKEIGKAAGWKEMPTERSPASKRHNEALTTMSNAFKKPKKS
ncbi:MAG: hypothetical protein AB7U41_00660 [Dongiaceae bacterium]